MGKKLVLMIIILANVFPSGDLPRSVLVFGYCYVVGGAVKVIVIAL